jgi:hypothetical protein
MSSPKKSSLSRGALPPHSRPGELFILLLIHGQGWAIVVQGIAEKLSAAPWSHSFCSNLSHIRELKT